METNLEISKILDKHLPADGVGTERETLRMNIHRDIAELVDKLITHNIEGQSEPDLNMKNKPKRFKWVCNECNFPNFTDSVSEEEIELELHACINCGCFEFHKKHFKL